MAVGDYCLNLNQPTRRWTKIDFTSYHQLHKPQLDADLINFDFYDLHHICLYDIHPVNQKIFYRLLMASDNLRNIDVFMAV